MQSIKLIGLILITYFLHSLTGHTQFYRYSNPAAEVDIEFLKEKLEVEAAGTFFNTVTVTNNSNSIINLNLKLTVPEGWSLMAEEKYVIDLEPGKNLIIPFRASISQRAKGDIGYIISASILDKKGTVLKNKYSFVHIPKKSKLTVRPVNRISYIGGENTITDLQVYVKNEGNAAELIGFKFTSNSYLELENEKNNTLEFNFIVPSHTDTIVKIPVKYITDEFGALIYKVDISAFNESIDYKTTVWYKYLTNDYENVLKREYVPLAIDLSAQNLFKEASPNYVFKVRGNTIFKKDNVLYYSLQSMNNWQEDFYNGTRFWVGYKTNQYNVKLGDLINGIAKPMQGKGLDFLIHLPKIAFRGVSVYDLKRNTANHGLNYFVKTKGPLNFDFQTVVESDYENKLDYGLVVAGTDFRLKSHNLRFQVGASNVLNSNDFNADNLGVYNRLLYTTKIKSTTIRLSNNFATNNYIGHNSGRWILIGQVNHQINNKEALLFDYNRNSFFPFSKNETFNRYSSLDNFNFSYVRHFNRNFSGIGGILYEDNRSNQFTGIIEENQNVHVYSPKARIALKVRGNNPYNFFNVSLTSSFNYIEDLKYEIGDLYSVLPSTSILTYTITSMFRSKYAGAFINFYNGPRTANQYLSYSLDKVAAKSIMISPYFEKFIYKDIVRSRIDLNYFGDIITKANRFTLNIQTNLFMNKGLEIDLLANMSYMSDYDQIEEETYKYSSTYFAVKIKKEFGWDQPRVKFHDINLYFYKDINGNRSKENKEPGIKDVLVFFKRVKDPEFEHTDNVEFMNVELLSDQTGMVSYEKLPEGIYEINLVPVGKSLGNFSAEESRMVLRIDDDKSIFIPFLENNKIFGKIVLNRSKISNLGRIDVSNIKVTAMNTQGKVYSALTNKSGNFTIFVPNVDKYVIKVNNIFYEHFDLQQNNFEVQLNGYRQFEVTYIFDERVRRINFDRQLEDYDFNGVKLVRRTNLRGTVKDAITLKPVRAKVQIVNTRNNSTVGVTSSNRTNGKFNTTFVAGDDYRLVVSAEDYWFFADNLYINQITTFQNLTKNILLKPITIGSNIELIGVNFESASSEILPEFIPELDRLLELLLENQNIRIEVQGFADDLETIDYPNISLERANSITKYLIEKGFSNVEAKGYGNTRPVESNDTENGRRRNRRIELEIISK